MFWKACVCIVLMDPSINESKNSEKPWFLLFCDFFMTFYVNVPSKRNKHKNLGKKIIIVFGVLKVTDEKSRIRSWIQIRSRSISQRYRSEDLDPDPYQSVTDLEYWCFVIDKCSNEKTKFESRWTDDAPLFLFHLLCCRYLMRQLVLKSLLRCIFY